MPLTKVSAGVIAANAVVDSFGTQSITGDKLGLTAINANNIVNASITVSQLATSLNLATNNVQVSSIQSATGTPAITFAANGQMTLANTPLQLTGGQIVFPATQISSADGNTLDDYEEGTWTPTLTYTGGNGNLSYAINDGTYIKIGKMVMFTCHLQFGETTASGYIDTINGLPFTSTARAGGGFNIDNMTGLTGGAQWQMLGSATTMIPTLSGTGTAGVISSTNTGAATNVIVLSGVYRA